MEEKGDYLRPDRIFRMWTFVANHNQLILRSELDDSSGDSTRAEVYFGNVQFVSMRPMQRGLFLRRPDSSRRAQLEKQYEFSSEQLDQIFVLDELGSNFIVSSDPAWREAPRDFDDPSLFDFNQQWPPAADVDWGTV